MRLLILRVQEPLPGRVLPEMAAIHGLDEAARRYRAIVLTTLRQLRGLQDTRIRLAVSPDDAHEAVRFWLLPRLAASWHMHQETFSSPGWEIDFGGPLHPFNVHASGEILCANLGARWVHTALLGIGNTVHQVRGPASSGGEYFRAVSTSAPPNPQTRLLPPLPIIHSSQDWDDALLSPLGPALKRAWLEEAHP